MRLDFQAAEKSYRTFRAEIYRVLRAGGASRATPVMRATAAGDYLDTFEEVVQAYKKTGSRDSGSEKVVYVRPGGYSSTELSLEVCEDSRGIRTYEGRQLVGRGELRTVKIEVRKLGGMWKLFDGKGRKVSACD